jgi:hypothetical protein
MWDVVLKKHDDKQKYGFSHANGKVQFLQDYAKAQKPFNSTGNEMNANVDNILPPSECPEALVIKRVAEHGLLEEWNFVHPEAEVIAGDRVIKVNNSQTIQDMQRELRLPSCVCTMLRYPEIFEVTIVKREGMRKLGFKFEKPANNSLLELRITEVAKDGLLDEVNRANMRSSRHHHVVLPGMRIEAANEAEGDCLKIAEELRHCDRVVMRIRRAAAVQMAQAKVGRQMKMLSAFGIGQKSPSKIFEGHASSGALRQEVSTMSS